MVLLTSFLPHSVQFYGTLKLPIHYQRLSRLGSGFYLFLWGSDFNCLASLTTQIYLSHIISSDITVWRVKWVNISVLGSGVDWCFLPVRTIIRTCSSLDLLKMFTAPPPNQLSTPLCITCGLLYIISFYLHASVLFLKNTLPLTNWSVQAFSVLI